MKLAQKYGRSVDRNLDEFDWIFPSGVWKLFQQDLMDFVNFDISFVMGFLDMVTDGECDKLSYHWKKQAQASCFEKCRMCKISYGQLIMAKGHPNGN